MDKILVLGSSGQIGTDLCIALTEKFGRENVVASDIKQPEKESMNFFSEFEKADFTDIKQAEKIIKKHDVSVVFHLAALLSGTGEKKPDLAWNINMSSLKNVLDLAKNYSFKIFWPSSIAVFGSSTPKNAPQKTILEPNTMYGITKVSGELLCSYYSEKFNVDARSLRFPGLISYKFFPSGGSTDFAVEMFYAALKEKKYKCFVRENTVLPMMYMPDAVNAAVKLMDSSKAVKGKSYNLGAMSFSAKELEKEIKKHVPEFECTYSPDFRQKIVDSWPESVDDSDARKEWNWKNEFDLKSMAEDMLEKLKLKLNVK